jgi:hypothetical protein
VGELLWVVKQRMWWVGRKKEREMRIIGVLSFLYTRNTAGRVRGRVRMCIREVSSTASGSYECPNQLRHPPRVDNTSHWPWIRSASLL